MIAAGKFDRVILVERRVDKIDPQYGTTTTAWEALSGPVRANVQDVLPSRSAETSANGIDVTRRPARVRMRWRTDIDSTMRIIYVDRDNRIMEILTQPAELGRREAIEFMVAEFSARGDA